MCANGPTAFNKTLNIMKHHEHIDFTKLHSHITDSDHLEATLNKLTYKGYIEGLVQIGLIFRKTVVDNRYENVVTYFS